MHERPANLTDDVLVWLVERAGPENCGLFVHFAMIGAFGDRFTRADRCAILFWFVKNWRDEDGNRPFGLPEFGAAEKAEKERRRAAMARYNAWLNKENETREE